MIYIYTKTKKKFWANRRESYWLVFSLAQAKDSQMSLHLFHTFRTHKGYLGKHIRMQRHPQPRKRVQTISVVCWENPKGAVPFSYSGPGKPIKIFLLLLTGLKRNTVVSLHRRNSTVCIWDSSSLLRGPQIVITIKN